MPKHGPPALLALTLALACGAPPDDGGPSVADAGDTLDAGLADAADAGGDGPPDAGHGGTSDAPNEKANGAWVIGHGTDMCGTDFRSGFTGQSIVGSTVRFGLRRVENFQGMPVTFDCTASATDDTFTCSPWSLAGPVAGGCHASIELRDVRGHIVGDAVDITATVQQLGGGPSHCAGSYTCGPGTIAGTGSISR